MTRDDALIGCLLGGMLGDAVGLPCERLRPQRITRLFAPVDGPRLLFRRGLISDDTEHAAMTAVALLKSRGEPDAFGSALAWQLRGWLLCVPAGAGLATLKAGVKLLLGFGPHRSGVFSAGNGPAMRAAIIGAWCDDLERLRDLVRVSTRMTHTDPQAEDGALLVALAARSAVHGELSWQGLLSQSRALPSPFLQMDDSPLIRYLEAASHWADKKSTFDWCSQNLGLTRGVSGYVAETVPVALHASWRHHDDFRAAISEVVACGGDTDTTAAIVGGIVGAGVGEAGLPRDWLERMVEFPRGVGYLRRLGRALAQNAPGDAPRLFWPAIPLRNAVFLSVVLWHAVRRMLPPY